MKKSLLYFFSILVLSQLTLTSCNKEEDEVNLLVGSWKYSEDLPNDVRIGKLFSFRTDYTGNGQSYILHGKDTTSFNSSEFDYSIEGNILSIINEKSDETQEMAFTISENILTIYAWDALVFTKI